MRYDRQYGRRSGSRQRSRDVDYGWGVPLRGMYDYSLDYGGISGPESEDSETIPPYESGHGDWTGPRPRRARYESHHWAAAEPSGESRYRGQERGRHGYERELGSFRSALEAARARARRGYERDFDRQAGPPAGPVWGRSRAGAGSSGWGGFPPGGGYGWGGWGGEGRGRDRWAPGADSAWSGRRPRDDRPRERPGGGYGHEYREQWAGGRSRWQGFQPGGRPPREAGWGFGWPRQGGPDDRWDDEAMRRGRGARGRDR